MRCNARVRPLISIVRVEDERQFDPARGTSRHVPRQVGGPKAANHGFPHILPVGALVNTPLVDFVAIGPGPDPESVRLEPFGRVAVGDAVLPEGVRPGLPIIRFPRSEVILHDAGRSDASRERPTITMTSPLIRIHESPQSGRLPDIDPGRRAICPNGHQRSAQEGKPGRHEGPITPPAPCRDTRRTRSAAAARSPLRESPT